MPIRSTALRLLQYASVLAAVLLQASGAFALSPDLRLNQLHHTVWTAHDGVPTGINSLAQTSDGYLWIAAAAGLYRFDGVRFERIDSIGEQRLLPNNPYKLFVPRTGGLWVGYQLGGASFISEGKLTNYDESKGLPAFRSVLDFAEDASGALWAGTSRGLRRFNGSTWEDVHEQAEYVQVMHTARDGTLWIIASRTVMALRPGQARFIATDIETGDEYSDFVEAPDGTLWLTDQELGARAVYVPNRATTPAQSWTALRTTRGDALYGRLVDREGTLWLTSGTGVHRLEDVSRLLDPRVDGKSPSSVSPGLDGAPWVDGPSLAEFLEDREGNVWIGTGSGLQRFRESRVKPVKFPRVADGFALTAGAKGAMLVGIDFEDGVYEITRTGDAKLVRGPHNISTAYRDDDGVVWFGGRGKVWHSSGPIDGPHETSEWIPKVLPVDPADADNHPVQAIAKDGAGRVWVSVVRAGTFRLNGDTWTRFGENAMTHATDADGRMWLGYAGNRIQIVDAQTNEVRELSIDDGLDLGHVLSIDAKKPGAAWVGGGLGLARFDGNRFHPVALRGGKSLSNVTGVVGTSDGELWLSTSEGAVRIDAQEVRQLLADPRYAARYELFDILDGMLGTPLAIRPLPSMAADTDGRLWFATGNGIAWIDPKRMKRNTHAPNVDVQAIVADDQRYEPTSGVKLPTRVRNLQITYTAPSLSIPERVRFRYQLGAGEPWQEAGSRRTAYFTDLAPGDYTFRVIAANDDGVWNETGAALEFTIPPAFYQTRWFYALCALACVGLLSLLYKLRMRQVAAQVRSRLEARLAERERIARDLHDTLLQGMQGLIWRFQAATDRIPSEQPARNLMEQSLDRADKLLAESRDKVKDLRPAASEVADLAQALATEGEHFTELHPASFKVSVQGVRRELHPIVREEGFLISREALSNAFRHAHANNIEAELTYEDHALHVRIRDDGRGIDSAVLDVGGRPGHFGLIGMRERAKKLGARLDVWSRPGAGTEVDLYVPADVAYRQMQVRSRGIRSWFGIFDFSAREH